MRTLTDKPDAHRAKPAGARRILPLLALAACGLHAVSFPAPAGWDPQWKCRRRIELKGAQRSSFAPLIAHCAFRDFGRLKEDASDVRVVNEQGKPVPFRVLFHHPRLYCVVAFEPGDVNWTGYVYYGNSQAPKLDNPWTPKSGLFLTTYRRHQGGFDNWTQMQQTVRDSFANPDGAGYRASIFDGFNPFGDSDNFVSYYDGWFYASRAGSYRFSTISDDASFVCIDGKLVAQWPGSHGAGGGLRGEHGGTVELLPGAHQVQYYHLQLIATTVAELAWTRPGETAPRLMAPGDYLPAFEAEAGLQESYNDPNVLEFSATPLSTLESGGHHYLLWRFGDLSGAPGSPSTASQWDFGNGLSSSLRSPFVWYLHPGDYEVTLRTTLAGGAVQTVKQWIRAQDLLQLDAAEKPGSFDRAAQQMADYPIGGLAEGDRRALLALLSSRRRTDALEKLCRAWLEDAYRNNAAVPVEAVLELGRVLADVRRNYPEAEKVCLEATRRLKPGDPLGYQVWLALGELRARRLGKYDDAIAALELANKQVKPDNESDHRRIALALGDAWRAKLNGGEARRHYQLAERLGRPSREDSQLRSSYGLTVESFLARADRTEALEKLQEWGERFPTDKLGGYWSLLLGRCLISLARYPEAVEELALAAKLEPFGNYTRDVLEQLGQAYAAQRRYPEALEALRAAARLFDDPARKRSLDEQIATLEREAGARR